MIDLMGGWEVMRPIVDRHETDWGKRKYTYIWRQKNFDPISHDAQFAIDFKFPDGRKQKDVFTYDWRIWMLPELRDLMSEAGFKKTFVYWEGDDKNGEGTGEFSQVDKQENCEVWIGYLVAKK